MHFAFAPYRLWFLAPIAAALLFISVRSRPSFAAGFLYALGLLAPMLHWLGAFHILAPFGIVLLSSLPYGVATHALRKTGLSPLLFALALTAAEFFRAIGIFAFPWGVTGSLAADFYFRSLAGAIGLFGFSFLLYFFSAAIVSRPKVALPSLALLLLGTSFLHPALSGDKIRIGIVQGNFSIEKDYEFEPEAVTDLLVSETRRLAARGAKIVVWTETVILEYLNHSGAVRSRIEALAREEGITIIAGAPSLISSRDKRNSAFFFGPADLARYDKVHLVPFGEYLPGYGPDEDHLFLPRGVGDFSGAPIPFPVSLCGPLICYEGVLPYLSKSHVNQGARVLVNLSNDAWSRSKAEAEQHLELTKLRAAEYRRPVIRAGNVGGSAIVEADGSVVAEIPAYRQGSILGEVTASETRTTVYFFGEWVGWIAFLGLPFFLTVKPLLGEVIR